MKLTEKTNEIYSYVKENGGRVSMEELVAVTGRTSRSIGANVLDLQKKGLAVRKKVAGEPGEDGKATTITYVVLTDEGKDFVPTEE